MHPVCRRALKQSGPVVCDDPIASRVRKHMEPLCPPRSLTLTATMSAINHLDEDEYDGIIG